MIVSNTSIIFPSSLASLSLSPDLTIQFEQAEYAFDEDYGTSSYFTILYDTAVENVSLEYTITQIDQTTTSKKASSIYAYIMHMKLMPKYDKYYRAIITHFA